MGLSEYNKPQNTTYFSKIHELKFYVLGNEENITDSNVNVTNKEVIKNNAPYTDGVYDGHLGTTDHNWSCLTCGNRKSVCPGHFGSIDVKYPVKSPMYREELLKWLKVTCYYCGKLLVQIKFSIKPTKRLNGLVKDVRTVKKCPHCFNQHWQVNRDKKRTLIFTRDLEEGKIVIKREEFYNHQIERVLQCIKESTVLSLGRPLCSHPNKFILRTIRVPPNTIRPDIRRHNGSRGSNFDTTSLLKMIVEINDNLPDDIPPNEQISQELTDMYFNLDMHYFSMVKGGGGGEIKLVTNTNKPPMAIAEHFSTKQGRIRKNLMGKRVEYMIRCVITGDSRLKIHEVGIPMIHARDLEIPETVTLKNRDRLTTYFVNKTDRYPGCKRIIKKSSDGSANNIKIMQADYQLQVGDIILRDMITGDYVSFNRQPSLLFCAIAGMRVVVMESGETLHLNPAICGYFGADFDGDQMNAILNQNIQSRNECLNISKVARWLISPQKQAPLVGAFQDALIGLAEITKDGQNFNKWHAMSLLSFITTATLDYTFDTKEYSNRSLVSRLLPEINMTGKTPSIYNEKYNQFIKYNPKDIEVNIIRGELQSGILDKATSGPNVMGSIFHIIANEYSNDVALDTIYNLQQMTHKFLLYHGFSTGISDINISENAIRAVKDKIGLVISESRKITHRLNNGKLIAPIGMSLVDYYEKEQLAVLSSGNDYAIPVLRDINLVVNNLARLIMTGTKGALSNFISINGAVGVQTINNKRFGSQAGWGRTSPYFVRYDTDPEANGFISTSFREGISSEVYSFMAGETRHGAISNALKTSVTGHQNRISVKNLESIIVDNLRKATKNYNVIQPLYAETGLDPAKTELVVFPTVMISDAEFESKYSCDIKSVNKIFQNDTVALMLKEEFEQLKADREKYHSIHMQLERHCPEYLMTNAKQMPVNVGRIVDDIVYHYSDLKTDLDAFKSDLSDVKTNKSYKNNKQSDNESNKLNPIYIIETVRTYCAELGYIFMNDYQRKAHGHLPKYFSYATQLMQILIRSYLCTSVLLRKGVVGSLLDIVLTKITLTYKRALINYGTSVGIMAALCISEPMTQFMLNARHRTGGLGGTTSNEITRIQEILGAKDTETMKHPHMIIMVKPEFEQIKIRVQDIANHIEMMNFARFVKATMIFAEKYGNPVYSRYAHEAKIIADIERHNYGQKLPGDLSNWCIRFELNKEELILKSMKLETIILALRKFCPELFVVYSPENSDEVFVRCYFRNSQFKQTNQYYEDNVLTTLTKVRAVIVRGIRDLISTEVMEITKNIKQVDGSYSNGKIWCIYAVGTNTSDLLSNPYVDAYRSQSDSLEEIERVFGIVAVRNKIVNELVAVSRDINRIHCTVFADEMTFSGSLTNIQKTGLQKRENSNITLRLSFQTPIQIIQNAAADGLVDRISGLSGPLIVGTNPNIGTTFNPIVVNEEFIKANVKTLEKTVEDL